MTTFYGKTFASSFSDLNLVGNAHQGTLSSYYTEISYGYACSDRTVIKQNQTSSLIPVSLINRVEFYTYGEIM